MEINKNTVITLDNNIKYVVGAIAIVDNIKYMYLIEKENMENIKICKQVRENEKIKVVVIEDPEELQKIVPYLYESAKSELEEIKST